MTDHNWPENLLEVQEIYLVVRHLLLDYIYRISTFMSFVSIWITTAILMNYYREKLINAIVYWVILSIPLVYFIITYFYQIILGSILISIVRIDPITVSIVLGAFLSLSKPIGGLLFGLVFWNISRIIGYERNIKTYMIISGWGILLIFSSNQALTQIIYSLPSFWTSYNYDFSLSIIFDVVRNL